MKKGDFIEFSIDYQFNMIEYSIQKKLPRIEHAMYSIIVENGIRCYIVKFIWIYNLEFY
jgi:hypothetical protein